ncbi:class I SAM-dependent methyltransferase [Paenalcaligenes niemegkensis]|uniref:class I SAM-dependent methyltransferase n=1 Tax=Paenalcaligenes niemegkensis TaxID=2895469 RepID=UPI001EE8465C|nr:class I SAM-dependent methyltransferase [Paenalcaligenes niemegkensis]MCQ9615376.1 class I SAM-dependent methyltransferase [Paenalcaligenes niemegkensis]
MSVDQAMIASVAQWLHTTPGRYVRAWEHKQVNNMVVNTFGYHAIQIGMPHWDLLRANRISHKLCTFNGPASDITRKGLVLCEAESLPFDSESIDLLVLPHVLECSADPHQVLREVERVLVPEGQVVLTGFNPYSLWGLRDRIPGLEQLMPVSPSHHVSLSRVNDWLSLLSFDIQQSSQGCFVPYCQSRKWLHRWAFMDVMAQRGWPLSGATYAISAIKRVNSMTLVGLNWSKQKQRVAQGAVMGASRDSGVYQSNE